MLKVSDALKTNADFKAPMFELGWRWALTELLTEENTDKWIAQLDRIDTPKWIPMWIVKRVLDHIFPDILTGLLKGILIKRGVDERRIHELNPFTK